MSSKRTRPTPQATQHVLKGFGPKSTRALAAIGIHSIEQLQALDPYEVYRQLKNRAPGTSLNFLYGLIAAAERCDWRDVQKTRRTEILLRLDEMGIAPK